MLTEHAASSSRYRRGAAVDQDLWNRTEGVGLIGLRFEPPSMGAPAVGNRSARARFRNAILYKSNPRSVVYVRKLFFDRFPEGAIVEVGEPGWSERVRNADEVVLLFADPNGLGWTRTERAVRRLRDSETVAVLNGRGRMFAFGTRERRRVLVRRALERSMILEFAALPLFVAASVVMLIVDRLRGRS